MKTFETFEEAMEFLCENHDQVTTRESLIGFAKTRIDDDMLMVAVHILDAVRLDEADYYTYDYSMGTLETPSSLETMEDIEHLLVDFN